MNYAIKTLRDYVVQRYFNDAKTFYLLVDTSHRVIAWEGPGAHYGLDGLNSGDDLGSKLPFLTGLDQDALPFTRLEFVETPSGAAAHLQIAYLKSGWGMVFMNATQEREDLQRHHQKVNERTLSCLKQESLLNEARRSQKVLQERVDELKQTNRSCSGFVEQIAHELRTPLMSLLDSAKQARAIGLAVCEQESLHQHLRSVDRGTNYLITLVDNLLDQSRIEKGQLYMNPGVWHLQEILECLDEIFRPVVGTREISLSWWVDAGVPEILYVDGMRLRQILFNLIGNAVKYTIEGSITVSVEWKEDRLSFSVADTGVGMDKATLDKLFQPFRQGPGNGNARLGAGLGLFISREIVSAMGGALEISSRLSQGTQASFHVEASPRLSRTEGRTAGQPDSCILIRDDDESIFF